MQDRYTGDAGDFGKFGLLRALHRLEPSLRLGLIWYLFPDEGHNADGKHTRYLDNSPRNDRRFRACDAELFDKLRYLVSSGNRRVAAVPGLGILPTSTVYFEECLQFDCTPAERLTARQTWIDRALIATAACDVVLLDPDNGLECGVSRRATRAGKYVYVDEIEPMVSRGQMVILYQHLDRSSPAPVQIQRRANRLASELSLTRKPTALRHRRGSSRVYYFLTQPEHERLVERAIQMLTSGPWSLHFSVTH